MFILESSTEVEKEYSNEVDALLLKVLDFGLNKISTERKELLDMDEKKLMDTLKSETFLSKSKGKYPINIPVAKQEEDTPTLSNVMILPFSLADEAFTCGEAIIYREYASELGLGIEKNADYVPFNVSNKKFDVAAARERYKVYRELDIHFQQLETLKKTLADQEKEYSETEPAIITPDNLTASNFKTVMKQKSYKMAEIIKELLTGIEGMPIQEAIAFVKSKSGIWYGFKDDNLSTVLHVSVERNLKTLVECLLACGAEVNCREGCGVTPLHLAVFHGHIEVVRTLLQYDAKPSGTFPGNIPSPLQAAQQQEKPLEIVKLLEDKSTEIKSQTEFLAHELLMGTAGMKAGTNTLSCNSESDNSNKSNKTESNLVGARDRVIAVGDVKTTTTTRGLRNRCPDEFGQFCETPGDFHTIGYCMDSISRLYGSGGFFYVIRHILNRSKITTEAFDKIFKEEHYERCFESINDFFWGLALAMVKSFEDSVYFPDANLLKQWDTQKGGYFSKLLLNRFQDWASENSKNDKTFQFFSDFVLEFGPLLLIYQSAIRNGQGIVREACWMKLLPIFTVLNKKNYRDEAFVHVLNFTCNWSVALRNMLRTNCSIKIKRSHHNLALDEFVETMLVRPLKVYARKQTTVAMLQKINMNLELLQHVQKVFKKSFDIHHTSKHAKQDSTPDKVKVAWFATTQGWFEDKGRDKIYSYPYGNKALPSHKEPIPKKLLDPVTRGKEMIRKSFHEMRCRLFPNTDYRPL